ncbi:MAG: TPM domain-containing protein [Cyclobacteriaceae bacterium]
MARLFSFLLLLSVPIFSQAQKAVPELWSMRVHDDAKVMSAGAAEQLESQLKLYEDSTSNQIAVLIVPSLDGDVLEEYSLRVAEKWKLGQKDKDNGVLLLIAIEDRKMRIEVGEGLEGVLTDALSNRIIRNEMAPEFRRGDYEAGVLAGVNGIIKAIGGEYTATESDGIGFEDQLSGSELIMVGLFIYGILGIFTFIGLVSGKAGWFLYFFLIPFWAVFPTFALGGSINILYGYLAGFPLLKLLIGSTAWGKRVSKSMEASSGRSGGGYSGGGWSSGGGSSGGFSGGGGSFGGGGSSGSW